MNIPYFKGCTWKDLSREERFYCFILYQHAILQEPREFAKFIRDKATWKEETTDYKNKTAIALDPSIDWEIGVEVCFYRDYRWHHGESVRDSDFSPKRTFDLCLFSPETIVIIEAKVAQDFDGEQIETFKDDRWKIPNLIKELDRTASTNVQTPKVLLVALASSKYVEPSLKRVNSALKDFDGSLTWQDVSTEYTDDPLFKQADELYDSKKMPALRKLT